MNQQVYREHFSGNAAENYQKYFVPAIGRPVAEDLIEVAKLKPGERVLDVACGTGVVTRLAATKVGASGSVAGLDVTPAMLAVARTETPPELGVEWHEGNAEAMPLADAAFDVVVCQMGLQFMSNKLAALREMRRVLATGGRVHVTVPGPKPAIFAAMADGLARHIGPEAASFADLVFSMHDRDELTGLLTSVGFRDVEIRSAPKSLPLPPPRDFLWQYIFSTPMAVAAQQVPHEKREALERDVCARWQEFVVDGHLALEVGITTANGTK